MRSPVPQEEEGKITDTDHDDDSDDDDSGDDDEHDIDRRRPSSKRRKKGKGGAGNSRPLVHDLFSHSNSGGFNTLPKWSSSRGLPVD